MHRVTLAFIFIIYDSILLQDHKLPFVGVMQITLTARGHEEHVRVSLIFAIIVSFMLFTVFTLANVLYFEEFMIQNDRICWACAIFCTIPNLQACTDGRTDVRTYGRTDVRTYGRTDVRTDGRTDGRINPGWAG